MVQVNSPQHPSSEPAASPFSTFASIPEAKGLYNPELEKDSCGLALIATLSGQASHHIVDQALVALRRLEHRGAVGADEGTGDGAGILLQIPDAFFRKTLSFDLPEPGSYAAGTAYLPTQGAEASELKAALVDMARDEGLNLLGWRELPLDLNHVGPSARAVMPHFVQMFVNQERPNQDSSKAQIELDQKAFRLRKRAQNKLGIYFPSFSSRTIVYKGMLTTAQLEPFYPDLSDPDFASKLAIVHSRFSTNTFPSWPLAQPFRTIAHNGEINTIKGNRNWMRARQSNMKSPLLGRKPEELFPICSPGASDSQSFDEVAELLLLSGRTAPQVMMMMIPEAWEKHETMSPELKAFYRYHSTLMEPWDGPAAVAFTDGNCLGAVLDRNGLRPGRYWVTDQGLVVLGSEVGIVDVPEENIVEKGRVSPGHMFFVDTQAGRIISDQEVKAQLAAQEPWQEWAQQAITNLTELPDREHIRYPSSSIVLRQQTFGYTTEELSKILAPMAQTGAEPIYAMGTDTPIAVLSQRPRLLFDYFIQSFAQVTNPPLDSIREELVTSLQTSIGPDGNLLSLQQVRSRQISIDFPVIDNDELDKIAHITDEDGMEVALKIGGLYNPNGGEEALRAKLTEICEKVSAAINRGVQHIILSDRNSNGQWAPIPSLLLTAAVHHHLLRSATRTRASLIVEAGDVREVHHVATLIGYGASAVNPYLAMESVEELVRQGKISGVSEEQAVKNLIKALGKGLQKIMSKMGISTVSSYTGAQTFEALGLSQRLCNEFFTGTNSQMDGVGLDVLAAEVKARHLRAYPHDGVSVPYRPLESGGEYDWRRDGAPHLFNPATIFRLQEATKTANYSLFKSYSALVDNQAKDLMTLRGLFTFKKSQRPPLPLDRVEPVSQIVKRFSTGAMSYGSISQEAHETLAIAMNSLGAKSNTGEGGEDPERLLDPQRRSAIKQVASGRFGVTSLYLTQAEDIQIKMAQGAKPGEGGQLMSQKVYPWVARTRHSTPGVTLISPPPHHDIYSIEDLAQLIYDLKRANPAARIQVKLVSELGVGTVAAGVAKAKADVVLISGHDGGTGAAPLNSLKHAGAPWELGLAEAQQTLLMNGLRDRIVLQADGQLKTGRDVVIAALLGAEEYGFATAPLVVEGCIMMRKCHLDTCPVGVATQNPLLRSRFKGQAEHLVNFFTFIAQEVREYLAQLGFASLDEAIGHAEALDMSAAISHWKAQGLDLSKTLLSSYQQYGGEGVRNTTAQDHNLQDHIDNRFIAGSAQAITGGQPVTFTAQVVNTDRSIGTMLGHTITKTLAERQLAQDSIRLNLTGHAGQSLAAFIPAGLTIHLTGNANDYAAKGLSGGRLIISLQDKSPMQAADNVIAGNVIGYGATSGEIYLNGLVGERFLVRNSGAVAVVEGIGDHGCEYMTGGKALILGATGRNFGAGMSGGYAYLLDIQMNRINKQAVENEDLLFLSLSEEDKREVLELLKEHAELTGSSLARQLLADEQGTLRRLTKVIPRDFAAVEQVRQQSRAQGLDPDSSQVWQKILEVTHG